MPNLLEPNPLLSIQTAYTEVSRASGVSISDRTNLFRTAVEIAFLRDSLQEAWRAALESTRTPAEALVACRQGLFDPSGYDLFEPGPEDNLPIFLPRPVRKISTPMGVHPSTAVHVLEKLGILEPERESTRQDREALSRLLGEGRVDLGTPSPGKETD